MKAVWVSDPSGARVPVAADGSTVASTVTSISVKFDRYMLPPTANRQGVCLQPDLKDVRSLEDCTSRVDLSPTYDPVTRTATYYLQAELTEQPYRLTVLNRGDASGFAAFDGVSLDKPHAFDFKATKVLGAALEKPPTAPLFCACTQAGCARQLGNVLKDRCPGCHEEKKSLSASMGMYLTSDAGTAFPAGLIETVIGETAHQTEQGGHAQVPQENGARFGVGMPRVAKGEPGNSYLMYKVLARDGLITDPDLAPGEADRLRLGLVVGQPMPPLPYSANMKEEDAQILSQWILNGAQTVDCPP
ncbi:MAG: hypothetical protein U0414_15685 [Polyangiaceae bacterium]